MRSICILRNLRIRLGRTTLPSWLCIVIHIGLSFRCAIFMIFHIAILRLALRTSVWLSRGRLTLYWVVSGHSWCQHHYPCASGPLQGNALRSMIISDPASTMTALVMSHTRPPRVKNSKGSSSSLDSLSSTNLRQQS